MKIRGAKLSMRKIKIKIKILTLVACLAGLSQPLIAAEAPQEGTAPPPAESPYLLGDWGGLRSSLAAHGILLQVDVTQFYQGVVDGSAGRSAWQYGLKGDYFINVIGEKLGLWSGLFLNFHVETRVGNDVNRWTGLSPANAATIMPGAGDVTALTQALAIQKLGEQAAFVVGKVNAYDLVDMVWHTGRGVDGFMNMSLVLPLGLGRTVPTGLPVVGALVFKGQEIQGGAVAYDANDCTNKSCLNPLFQNPAIAAFWKFFTGSRHEGGREGYVSVGGTWSSKEYSVVDPASLIINPAVGLEFADKQQSWSIFSIVDQPLWVDPSNPNRNISFKGMYSFTDGKANPIKWTATAALNVAGPFRSRDKDAFGIGYFHNELSSGFKEVVGNLLSIAETIENGELTRIAIEDTDGFEMYYKAQVTPWFALTADLQVITRTLSTNQTKIVTGVRAKVSF